MAQPLGEDLEADLESFEIKLKQLKREYEAYFVGTRPRPPQMLRDEVQRTVSFWSGTPIVNTALRFKFNTLCARFFAQRGQWEKNMRQIEDGTYQPHLFKAKLRVGTAKTAPPKATKAPRKKSDDELFSAYQEARSACGDSKTVTRENFQAALRKQARSLREKHGCDEIRFRVVVEKGKARLKATPVRG